LAEGWTSLLIEFEGKHALFDRADAILKEIHELAYEPFVNLITEPAQTFADVWWLYESPAEATT
jgi:hypothetical protein